MSPGPAVFVCLLLIWCSQIAIGLISEESFDDRKQGCSCREQLHLGQYPHIESSWGMVAVECLYLYYGYHSVLLAYMGD